MPRGMGPLLARNKTAPQDSNMMLLGSGVGLNQKSSNGIILHHQTHQGAGPQSSASPRSQSLLSRFSVSSICTHETRSGSVSPVFAGVYPPQSQIGRAHVRTPVT